MVTGNSQQAIFTVLASIPAGRIVTYGRVAELAGMPGAARRVGTVLKTIPGDSTLPWHRVLRANGRIAFSPGSKAFRHQQAKLEKEGIQVINGRVDLDQFGLHP